MTAREFGKSWVGGLLLLSAAQLSADEPASTWSIRTEILVVEMPQSSAMALRGQLTNDTTVESAVKEIQAMTISGDASLVGTAVIWNLSGESGTSEMNEEIRYGTPFELPASDSPFERPPDIGPAQV